MILEREHPGFEVLNDYVDGRLESDKRAAVSEHLDHCDACQREHADLSELLQSMSSLPASVSPPDDLWADVRALIDAGKEVPLRLTAMPSAPYSRRPWWANRWGVAAAAASLVIASSGVTAIVLRGVVGSTLPAEVRASAPTGGASMLPVSFRRAETEYLRTIAELRSTLHANRNVLRPETIAAVEHSLSVVDSAIEEARAALLNDPRNDTLVDLLTASYERKVDLLRRARDLGV